MLEKIARLIEKLKQDREKTLLAWIERDPEAVAQYVIHLENKTVTR